MTGALTTPELDKIRLERVARRNTRTDLHERRAETLAPDALRDALLSKRGIQAVRRLVKGHWRGHDGMPTVADVAAALDTLLDPRPAKKA